MDLEEAYAHCDVPCGIYDPYPAQIDAHTVLRMVDLMAGLEDSDPEKKLKYARYVATKELHAEALKNKVRVIFGDFLTPGKASDDGALVDLVREIFKVASSARQTSSKDVANDLVEKVNKFSEMFWAVKGKSTRRIASPYPTGGEMVVPE